MTHLGELRVKSSIILFKKVSTVKASTNKTDRIFFLKDVVFQWLTTNDIQLNNIDAEDPEVWNVFLPLCNFEIGILGLQPCDKAAMLRVNTIENFLEEFT